VKREGCAAVKIDAERALVIGGFDGSNSLNTTEILNYGTGCFAPGPKMRVARWGCAAVKVNDKQIIVIGGRVGNESLNSTEILDIDTLMFRAGPKLAARRHGCAAVMLSSQRLLVIGGSAGREFLNTTEELQHDCRLPLPHFKPSSKSGPTFAEGPRLISKRSFCSATLVRDGQLLVAGGDDGTKRLHSTEVFKVLNGIGFEPGPDLDGPRVSMTAVLVPTFPPRAHPACGSTHVTKLGSLNMSSRGSPSSKLDAIMGSAGRLGKVRESTHSERSESLDDSFGIFDLLAETTSHAALKSPNLPVFSADVSGQPSMPSQFAGSGPFVLSPEADMGSEQHGGQSKPVSKANRLSIFTPQTCRLSIFQESQLESNKYEDLLQHSVSKEANALAVGTSRDSDIAELLL